MSEKPTYEALGQRVKALEMEIAERADTEQALKNSQRLSVKPMRFESMTVLKRREWRLSKRPKDSIKRRHRCRVNSER
jgi:hypothetical protein